MPSGRWQSGLIPGIVTSGEFAAVHTGYMCGAVPRAVLFVGIATDRPRLKAEYVALCEQIETCGKERVNDGRAIDTGGRASMSLRPDIDVLQSLIEWRGITIDQRNAEHNGLYAMRACEQLKLRCDRCKGECEHMRRRIARGRRAGVGEDAGQGVSSQ